jgi:hypothetical protein
LEAGLDKIGIPCVYKVWFGKKYFIWKGKSLSQSLDIIGKAIQLRIIRRNLDTTDFMYHVVKHIKRNQIKQGHVSTENVYTDFDTASGNFSGFNMLRDEQMLLDASAQDIMCLNNNEQAYVPDNNAYISNKDKEAFLRLYEKTRKKSKKK